MYAVNLVNKVAVFHFRLAVALNGNTCRKIAGLYFAAAQFIIIVFRMY